MIPEVGKSYLCNYDGFCWIMEVVRIIGMDVEYNYWTSSGNPGFCAESRYKEWLVNAKPLTEDQKDCLINLWTPQYK